MALGMIRSLFNGTSLTSTTSITSDSFRIDEGSDLGIWCKGTVGTASYTPILQVSPDEVAANFVAPIGYPSVATIAGSAAQMANITQHNMMYGRIVFSGLGATPSTLMTSYIFNREDYF